MNGFCALLVAGLTALISPAFGQRAPAAMIPLVKDPPRGLVGAMPAGPKASSDLLHLTVSLVPRDPAGLQSFVNAVSDPSNAMYRHFIRPEQIGARFGLPSSEVGKVAAYLSAQGMKIRLVAKNRLAILADSTVAQAQSAFHTSIQNFSVVPADSLDSGRRYSFMSAPELPKEIAWDVVDVSGLENFTRPHHALVPTQIEGLYAAATLYGLGSQGQGRTVAISNWDGFRISNEVLECSQFGLPVPTQGAGSNITVETVEDGNGSAGPEYGEGDLDIQASIAMAPLCHLIIYDDDDPNGNDDPIGTWTQEAEDDSADVITESYGWFLDIADGAAAHNQHVSMSAEGITYLAAAGDSGTSLEYPYPVIDPEVLTVGGTSATVTSSNSRLSEVVWNNLSGAGGGGWIQTEDAFNIRPPYQSTPTFEAWAGVPSMTDAPCRLLPDLALNADPDTGYSVFIESQDYIIGGTSGASPTCAGGLAVVEQQLVSDGFLPADANGHHRFGRIQNLLYSYNEDASVFFDIVSGNIGTLPNGALSQAVPGWDTASGWGAPSFAGLVARVEHVPTVSALSLSATVINGGKPVTGTVTISMPAPSAGVSVKLSATGSYVQVPSSVTVEAGQTTAIFPVTTDGVASEEVVDITASTAYGLQGAQLSLFAATYQAVTISPNAIAGGDTAIGTVALQGAAPAGGFTVTLSSSSSLASVPASVKIPANAMSATFPITTTPVSKGGSATITGTAPTGLAKSATLTIKTATVQSVVLSAFTVVGGSDTVLTGTVTLYGPAIKAGDVVSLSSSNPKIVSVPATVKVAAGSTTATFKVVHHLVPANQNVNITATLNGAPATTGVTVLPFALQGLSVSPSAAGGGASATGTVTLNAAPGSGSGGVHVKLMSSSRSVTVPATVVVAIGSPTATFAVKTAAASVNSTATLTATLNSKSETASLSVQAPFLKSVSVTPASVKGSAATHVAGTVQISGIAPAGGLMVSLTSSNTSAAGVPASVTIPEGRSSVTFTVSHKKVATQSVVTITASLAGVQETTMLTVTPG